MTRNISPEIAAARDISKKFNFDHVIIIGVNNDRDQMKAISYGDAKSSGQAEDYATVAYDAIYDYINENFYSI